MRGTELDDAPPPSGRVDGARPVASRPAAERRRLLVAIVVGGLLLIALALSGLVRTRDLLAPEGNTLVDSKAAAYECLTSRIEARVPAGASVQFVSTERDLMRDEWYQRAITESYPRNRIVAREEAADVVVALGAWAGACPSVTVRTATAR